MSVGAATAEALALLLDGDGALWGVVATTLTIALAALAAALPLALGLAYLLAAHRFVGRDVLLAGTHALLATPTVVVGLVLFVLLAADGPLGALELLFTPAAVALGQFVIALPILVAFSHAAIATNVTIVRETAITLGAGGPGAALKVIVENRRGVLAALLAGFGRIVSEVGCALLVGGNIAGATRTIPTAIALDTGKGRFAEGIALGVVLLVLAAAASLLLYLVRRRERT